MSDPAVTGPRVGEVFAHYKVVGRLGAGGMGVVYKAEDVRLGRFVALKVLPQDLARDPIALGRFRREAQAASALNHPGICTIYDIGEADGTAYLAMEYLEGASLDALIARGRLPPAQVLSVARDIADALDAAHAAGILHRDVKPGNILVTTRGQAKLLDFGVARVERQHGGEPATVTSLTVPGTTVGTVAYMSPEQVRGTEVDARSDLFSLGAVLYEMATGARAFQGDTPGLIFDAILNRMPPPRTRSGSPVSLDLERIIDRALEKDPDLRYQTAADLRADLVRIARGAPGLTRTSRKRRAAWAMAATTVVVIAAAVGLSRWYRPAQRVPFEHFTITQVTNTGNAQLAAISPDGRFIANVQKGDGVQSLWLRNVATGSDTEVAPAAPVVYGSVTFSPDGDYLYFRRADGADLNVQNLLRQPVLGGQPQLLVRDIDTNVSFSPAGDHMAFVRSNSPELGRMSLLIANADGTGERSLLSAPINGAYTSAPAWSLDADRIAYTESFTADALGRLSVYDLRTNQARTIFSSSDVVPSNPQWSADGRTLFVLYGTRRTALAQRQIGSIAYPAGTFRTVTNDTNDYAGVQLSADRRSIVTVQSRTLNRVDLRAVGASDATARELLSMRDTIRGFRWSRTGEIVYSTGSRIVARRPDGAERTILSAEAGAPPGALDVCAGDRVVFAWLLRGDGGAPQLWRVNTDGSDQTLLVSGRGRLGGPTCSPDGEWVAFNALPRIMRVRTSGGAPEPLGTFVAMSGLGYAPDGRTLALIAGVRPPGASKPDRKLVLIHPGAAPQFRDIDDFSGGAVRFTPDGTAVAYVVKNGVEEQLIAQPLDGSAVRVLGAFSGGHVASFDWSPDGRTIAALRQYGDSDVVLLTDSK